MIRSQETYLVCYTNNLRGEERCTRTGSAFLCRSIPLVPKSPDPMVGAFSREGPRLPKKWEVTK